MDPKLTMDDIRKILRTTETPRMYERERLEKINMYVRGPQPGPYKPTKVNAEYRTLVKRSQTNLMPMMLRAITDQLYIEGYRTKTGKANEPGWNYWQANGFDSRQGQIFRSAIRDGYAYGTTLPGKIDGKDVPVMCGVSAKRMYARYEDPVEDKYPVDAIYLNARGEPVGILDDHHKYEIGRKPGDMFLSITDVKEHGVGVCPVVRYAPAMDLDGVCAGDVEPLFEIQDRVNQTAFDLLIAQTYGSFIVRGISGMEQPIDPATGKPTAIEFDVRRLITSKEPDMKGWQFDPTPLEPYINALQLGVQHFAMLSQTPPHYLLANMANLAADAIVAANASSLNKRGSYQHTLGEQAESQLELAQAIAGDDVLGEGDQHATVLWSDIGSRSLAQAADSLGKMADQLEIPAQALWSRIPGWTQADTDYATQLLKERAAALAANDPYALMLERMRDNMASNGQPKAKPDVAA